MSNDIINDEFVHGRHVCSAGLTKLVVTFDGHYIPCSAFKGLYKICPEFDLGHISEVTMAEALRRGRRIPYLRCFRRYQASRLRWLRHEASCLTCQDIEAICEDGARLLVDTLQKQEVFERMAEESKRVR